MVEIKKYLIKYYNFLNRHTIGYGDNRSIDDFSR